MQKDAVRCTAMPSLSVACRRKGGLVDEAAAARVLAVLAALWGKLPPPAAEDGATAAVQPHQPSEQPTQQQVSQRSPLRGLNNGNIHSNHSHQWCCSHALI